MKSMDSGARLSGLKAHLLSCCKIIQCVCARARGCQGAGGSRGEGSGRVRGFAEAGEGVRRYTVLLFYFCVCLKLPITKAYK